MNKGDTLHHDGKSFKVQKMVSDSIYASLIVSEGKCQRGKPRRLFYTELAASAGISVEEYIARVKGDQVSQPSPKAVMKQQLVQSDMSSEDDSDSSETEIVSDEESVEAESSDSSEEGGTSGRSDGPRADKTALREVLETLDTL